MTEVIDLVGRLRAEHADWRVGDCVLEAATLLTRQAELLREARDALRVFAAEADWAGDDYSGNTGLGEMAYSSLTIADLRRARSVLQALEEIRD